MTISGKPALVDEGNNFRGTVSTTSGTNTFTIVANDASGNTTTQQYEVDLAGSSKSFSYDANGNLVSDGTREFAWDARNQIVSIEVGIARSEFTYDGTLRRTTLAEKVSGVISFQREFIQCELQICEERDGATIMRRAFEAAEIVNGTNQYLSSDHLGSITEVVNESGSLIGRYAYGPWGQRTLSSGSDVTTAGFTGYRQHANGNLSLAILRPYDSSVGRWYSEDPAGFSQGPNLNVYVGNRPTTGKDVLGDCEQKRCSIVIKGREIEHWIKYIPGVPHHYAAEVTIDDQSYTVEGGPKEGTSNLHAYVHPNSTTGSMTWSEVPTSCAKAECLKQSGSDSGIDTGRKYAPLKWDSGDYLDQLLKRCGYPGIRWR